MPRGKKTPRADIVTAAAQALAERGTSVTMDEIAEAAGVSRRTLFRHYPTKGELVADAMRHGWERWRAQAEVAIDASDLETSVRDLLVKAQTLNAQAGRGFWELASGVVDEPELREAAALRAETRRQYVPLVARQLWDAAGGTGSPPRVVIDAYGLLESIHSLRALHPDLETSPERVGEVCAEVMLAVLHQAVSDAKAKRPAQRAG